MGKCDDQRKLKLCVLAKIKEKKHILFGGFSDKLSKEDKAREWKNIKSYAESLGLVQGNREWTYVRDVWWPNVRKSATEKLDNAKKTGTGGGKDVKLNEVDDEVFNVIGKDSPVICDLGVLTSLDLPQHTPELLPIDHESQYEKMPHTSNNDEATTMLTNNHSASPRGRNKKKNTMVSDCDEKRQLQIELLKVQIYKSKLEARQLEMSMGLPCSEFTAAISEEVNYVIDNLSHIVTVDNDIPNVIDNSNANK